MELSRDDLKISAVVKSKKERLDGCVNADKADWGESR